MKFIKVVSLSAAALGTLLAASCCESRPAPAPASPTYVAPAK
ncbi:hypothetical protein OJ996_14705 [Luteolibacter sp. GHJ8]|jgi:hypothetical protein|uniref:Lipoprotein n=1 Tax=Luteolibacter rhizosphaerae TaxID=2989719 RepID=A0ABT3G4U2_9BACT|nr:hypothetical protein [Luteolibacter rhizosphaerae]MCW1914835.1 hypothetical protein [Luteolibacter rhizosphaerae]